MLVAELRHKPHTAHTAPGFADNCSDYLFWALVAPRTSYGIDINLRRIDSSALQHLAIGMIKGWHPGLRRLVGESDTHTVTSLPILTSGPIQPWSATKCQPDG